MTWTDPLPPGVHPQDQSVPWTQHMDENLPYQPDVGQPHPVRGQKAWATENADALGVFQRLGAEWSCGLVAVTETTGLIPATLVVPRQRGRTALSLWVPNQVPINNVMTTTPAGVMVAATDGDAYEAFSSGTAGVRAVPLGVGDSLPLYTEGQVWVGLLPGTTIGYVAYALAVSPAGGGLGAT